MLPSTENSLRIPTAAIFRPSSIAIVGACMSAIVWSLPTFGAVQTGYVHASAITPGAVFLILGWYLLIWCTLRFGEIAGAGLVVTARPERIRLESTALLGTFTALAATGLIATYAKVLGSLGLQGAVLFVMSGLANELKGSLYEEYSAGIVSLRYLVAFSAALAVYRYGLRKKFDGWMLTNLLLLAMSALLSSRLIFIASVVIATFLTKRWQRFLTINVPRLLVGVAAIFFVLTLLNYSRNGNYYASDGFGFWGAGLSSIVAYVGSPFQVMLAAADNPVFLFDHGEDSARLIADIDDTLNSNSAFVQVQEAMGALAWPYIGLLCAAMGFVFGACARSGRTVLLLPCGAILYASAELWRLELYSQGIFKVWLGMGLLVPAAFLLVPRVKLPRIRWR